MRSLWLASTHRPMSAMSGMSSTGTGSPLRRAKRRRQRPDMHLGAASGTAPGKMSTASNGMTPMQTGQANPDSKCSHPHWPSTATLPANAGATTCLHIANSAIGHHNVTLADDALSHAETQLLNRAVPQGQIMADSSAPVQSIESARKALHAGNHSQASTDTKQAASAITGMSFATPRS